MVDSDIFLFNLLFRGIEHFWTTYFGDGTLLDHFFLSVMLNWISAYLWFKVFVFYGEEKNDLKTVWLDLFVKSSNLDFWRQKIISFVKSF